MRSKLGQTLARVEVRAMAFEQVGFGVAVALFLDATIVRSVVLRWLGWLPRVEVSRHPQAQAALSPEAG